MSYPFLLMAVASLGMLGVMHKVADHRRCGPAAITFLLFFGAAAALSAISIARLGWPGAFRIPAAAWLTATACGGLASIAILNFQHGIRFGKISTSWLIINLSTALPTILSIAIYREAVSLRRACGLLLSVVALLILWRERAQEERSRRGAAVTEPELLEGGHV